MSRSALPLVPAIAAARSLRAGGGGLRGSLAFGTGASLLAKAFSGQRSTLGRVGLTAAGLALVVWAQKRPVRR